jgi:hypothetical protein
MSIRARLAKFRSIVVTVLLISLFAILGVLDVVQIGEFSPTLAAAIFTVIIGTVGTLFSILVVYSELIASAGDLGHLTDLKRTFGWPVGVSVIGFTIAILSNVFSLSQGIVTPNQFVFTLSQWYSLLMTGLLLYAILSFGDAFSFTLRTIIEMETK